MLASRFRRTVIGLVAVGALLLGGPALAQRMPEGQERGNGARGQRMMQKLSSELQLSEEQQVQLQSIFQSRKGEMKQFKEQMKSLFTEEQRAALREMRRNRRNGNGERPSREEMKQRMAEMGISPEQMEQMGSLRRQMKAKRESMRAEISAILTPDQQARFEQMRAERKNKRGRRGGRRGEFRKRQGGE